MSNLKESFEEHLKLVSDCSKDPQFSMQVERCIDLMVNCLKNSNKILFCGNGGSAADSAHLAAELSGKFKMERKPLNAEALHVNGSSLTAIANDFGYEQVFSRVLEAKAQSGDLLFAMSTSGHSANILKALEKALELNLSIIYLTGEISQPLSQTLDVHIQIPSTNTPRIQELMILTGHHICESIESQLFG